MENHSDTQGDVYQRLFHESAEDLYENAPCGYIYTLPNGTIVKVNQTFLNWMGYRREELLAGKRLQDLLVVGGKIFYETHYAPLLRMQGAVNEINFDLVHKDGHLLPVLLNTVQKRDAAGKPLLNRTTLFNISDRKRYEQELVLARKKAEQAAKAKADFLSTISHEIRTPMNAIIGISSLLKDTTLSPEQHKYVHLLKSSSENLLNLLNDVLDFSKIEAGKVTLEARSFDIRELVSRVLYGLNVKAEEKNLDVRMDIDELVPGYLRGDPIKIGQVLTNLVSNAIKFTERGGVTVALRVRELSGEAASIDFRVTDTGIGIPRDRLSQVFEEFTQASYDIHLKYGGTGLGLTISQKLLELYGSKMAVESTPGVGTCFSFNLRLKIGREAEAGPGPAESVPDAQTLRGLKVLVAEDNAVNVFVLSQFLRKWSVHFEVVGTGQQALQKVMGERYDLVLMDLQMPELDGYAATQAIRDLPGDGFRRLPIIALTASNKIGLDERLDSAGFTDFIGKPFKPEALFTKLALHGSRQLPGPVERPSSGDGAGARASLDSATPVPRFSLEELRELAGEDSQALHELSTIAITTHEEYKDIFRKVLEAGNQEDFDFYYHKIKTTTELLHAYALRDALHRGRTLLAANDKDAARVQAAIHDIHYELESIISGLKAELQKT
ncbi:MAG TPA: ATP-binding protein [Archangium sp.]|uniref:ATP-binding protein n=1 Tax=Archangium sp. TaxID=1872627 RepID=UPI002ED7B9B2